MGTQACVHPSEAWLTGILSKHSLHELWSLLNILFPEALSSSAAFDAGFRIAALYQQVPPAPISRLFSRLDLAHKALNHEP